MGTGGLDAHRVMPGDNTRGDVLTVAGLGKAWRVLEARREAIPSTFLAKVEATPELWPEESERADTSVTCHEHVEPT